MTTAAQLRNKYFSEDYKEGRRKFYAACKSANLRPAAHLHPAITGPYGEEIAMDSVWLGPKDAAKVIVVTCGTHGLEAAAGAATILQWLDGDRTLPDNTAMLIVHAINPFGWAYDSRGNEDGVDLNRNCIDHNAAPPVNKVYDELHPLIKGAGVSAAALDDFVKTFASFCNEKGFGYAVSGLTSGQYAHADGISYGGDRLSWSCQMFYEIARDALARAEKILFIDWHTGIGPYGEPFFILDDEKTSAAYALAASWWPANEIHSDDIIDGVAPDYTGVLTEGFKREIIPLRNADIVSLVIEWGTYDVNMMLQALLLDRWLRLNRDDENEALIGDVRRRLVERFYPSDSTWRDAVLAKAGPIYRQALAGVSQW